MADKHPYISGAGPLLQTLEQFRKSFPGSVSAETLKKLGLAPSNESFIINILRFVGLVGEDGSRTPDAQATFTKHDDNDFANAFEALVRKAYKDLFELHKDDAWTLPSEKLISFFRTTDQTSDLVGKRQALTFQALASFAGHGNAHVKEKNASKSAGGGKATKSTGAAKPAKAATKGDGAGETTSTNAGFGGSSVGLTVRIEINLPAQGDQETYDRIFASLRKNLLNG